MKTVFAAALLMCASVTSFAADTISAAYDVEVANVRVMRIKQNFALDGKKYSASFEAKTKGLMNLFTKIKLVLDTNGNVSKSGMAPSAMVFNREKNGNETSFTVKWNKAGVASIERKFEGDALARLQAALETGARDPMSILMERGLRGGDQPCEGSHRAYDGRDVYDLVFKPTVTSAETITCKITLVTVAGRDFDKALPKKVPNSTYVSVMRKFAQKGLANPVYVPVKVRGKLEGRDFEATLDALAINGSAVGY